MDSTKLPAPESLLRAIDEAVQRDAIGIRVLDLVAEQADAQADVAARLVALGFVIVDLGGDARLDSTAARGRHIALFVTGPNDVKAAIEWTRRLSETSPRGHLVVRWRRSDVPRTDQSDPRHVCETAFDAVRTHVRRFDFALGDKRVARAERYLRQRRLTAAARWSRATVEAAARQDRADVAIRVSGQLIDGLIEHGDVHSALALAMAAMRRARTLRDRADAVALGARVLVQSVELERAEALLAGARAEAALSNEALPDVVRSGLRDVYFWRGRMEEARDAARQARPADPDDTGSAVLVAWACADRDLLWTCEARLAAAAARGERRADFWLAAARALSAALPDPACGRRAGQPEIEELLRIVIASASGSWMVLAQALAAQVRIDAGLPRANDNARAAAPPTTPLFALLREWLHAHDAEDRQAGDEVLAHIRRAGARGLERWGRHGMHLVQDWPALLDIVQDAEDELVALTRGCAWIRRQAHASGAAVVDAEGKTCLAVDGWTRQQFASGDLQPAIGSPAGTTTLVGDRAFGSALVKYAGHTIGRVIAASDVRARGTLDQAVRALAALAGPAVRARLDALAVSRAAHALTPEIIGRSVAIETVRETIGKVAGTTFSVLIEGESGTGKELVARAIHRLSPRRDRALCAVNCAAFTDELFEAELFGFARGAFTGAVNARTGLIEDAHQGTLFLDEVGDLSPRAQAKLLRALQEREVRRLGENLARPVDVRVVSATNVPLAAAVGEGRFREDLLFRLAVVRLRVPPLRDRVEDIPLVAQACWRQLASESGTRAILGPDAIAALCRHGWPGNIRELQNVLAALIVIAPVRGRVGARHVARVLGADTTVWSGISLGAARRECERRTIAAALVRHGGCRASAARELGLSRQGLVKAMRRLDRIDSDRSAGVA